MKRSEFKPARERIAALPDARRLRIEADASSIVEEMELAELRKSLGLTQMELAERAGIAQGDVSRFERTDLMSVRLGSLVRYAESLDATLKVTLALRSADGAVRFVEIKL